MNNSQKILFSSALALIIAGSTHAADIKDLQPGTLADAGITATETSLTITGQMNAADFSYILDNLNDLESLNLAGATIVAYNGEALPYTGVKTSAANTLPDYALTGLTRLKTIVLPTSLKAIGKGSLSGSGITSLTVPSSVETIGDYAAMRCESLEEITIGKNVKEFGTRAFAYCPKLTTLSIIANNAQISEGMFEACGGLTEVSLIELANCEEIGAWAFAECNGLKTLVLPATTTTLCKGALYGTSKISTFELPENITYLSDNAMSAMSALETLNTTHVSGVPELGNNVWANVNQKNVTLVTPDDMVDAYSETPQWKEFNIVAEKDWTGETKSIVYPAENPVMAVTTDNGQLLIRAIEGRLGKVAVFNAAGSRIVSTNAAESLSINVGGWAKGVYLIVSELGTAKIAL